MVSARNVPSEKLDSPVKVFHNFAIASKSLVTKAGHNCDETHVVFNTYIEDSIKNEEDVFVCLLYHTTVNSRDVDGLLY